MQLDVHKTHHPSYTTKKMPYVTATATKNALRCRINASFSLMLLFMQYKTRGLPLSAVTVSLHYLPKMSVF